MTEWLSDESEPLVGQPSVGNHPLAVALSELIRDNCLLLRYLGQPKGHYLLIFFAIL